MEEEVATKHFRYKFYKVKAFNVVVLKVKSCEDAEPDIKTVTRVDFVFELS